MSADERRELVLRVAGTHFAEGGLDGTSTEDIARAAGISQPYLFRLFSTKRALFTASCERVFARIEAVFREAADGVTGEQALTAMGGAYVELIHDRELVLHMQQAFVACRDPEVRAATRAGFARLHGVVTTLSGADPETVRQFFATGMLLNVVAAMDLLDPTVPVEPWAQSLVPPS
ncbi:TetR family transcriptional regulator [Motilibacter rhizosphaerae]|uniref:TetR family transcriptional regulator n=2 Tax=Motilibacter rhizosphaerae TaxID=598652 RepID=A0A4Q7NNK3_9ACTN|nr:TetR family transcriptional regulator [Motilibacter rhizosphaerae]